MAENNKLPILPTVEDFSAGGVLEGIEIPDMGPIPKEVVKFMFGDENYAMTKAYTFKILTYLHELFHWDIRYCDCLSHILYKREIRDSDEDVVHLNQEKEDKTPFSSFHNIF